MAASTPLGEMQFWYNGFPFTTVQLGSNDAGEMQFWYNGAPLSAQFPQPVAIPAVPFGWVGCFPAGYRRRGG